MLRVINRRGVYFPHYTEISQRDVLNLARGIGTGLIWTLRALDKCCSSNSVEQFSRMRPLRLQHTRFFATTELNNEHKATLVSVYLSFINSIYPMQFRIQLYLARFSTFQLLEK